MDENMTWAEFQRMLEEEKANNPEPEEEVPKKKVVRRPIVKKPTLTPEQLEKKKKREEAERKRREEMRASIMAKRKQLMKEKQASKAAENGTSENKEEDNLKVNEFTNQESLTTDKPDVQPQPENIETVNQEEKKEETSTVIPSEISPETNQISSLESDKLTEKPSEPPVDANNVISQEDIKTDIKPLEESTENIQSTEQIKPIEETKPKEENQPSEENKPAEEIKPIENIKPMEEKILLEQTNLSIEPQSTKVETTDVQMPNETSKLVNELNYETVIEKNDLFNFKPIEPTEQLNEPLITSTSTTVDNQPLNLTDNINYAPSRDNNLISPLEPSQQDQSNENKKDHSQLTETIETLKLNEKPDSNEVKVQQTIPKSEVIKTKEVDQSTNVSTPTPINQREVVPQPPQSISHINNASPQSTNVTTSTNYPQSSPHVIPSKVQQHPSLVVPQPLNDGQPQPTIPHHHPVVPQPVIPPSTSQTSNTMKSPSPSQPMTQHVNHTYNESYNPPLSPHVHGNVMPREHIHSPNFDYYHQTPNQQHNYHNLRTPQRNVVPPPYGESPRHTPTYTEPSFSSEPGYSHDYNHSMYDQPYGHFYSSSPKGYTSRINMIENRYNSLFGTPSRYFNPSWKEKSFHDQSSSSLSFAPSWLTSTNLSENKDLEKIRKDTEKQFKNLLLNFENSVMKHYESNLESRQGDIFKELESLKRKNEEMSIEIAKLKQKNEILMAQNREANKELNVIKAKGQLQDSKILNLQEQLNLKVQENLKLAQLCDELINNLELSQKNQR